MDTDALYAEVHATAPGEPTVVHPCATHADLQRTVKALRAHLAGIVTARFEVWVRQDCGHLHLMVFEIYTSHHHWDLLLSPRRILAVALHAPEDPTRPDDAAVTAKGGSA